MMMIEMSVLSVDLPQVGKEAEPVCDPDCGFSDVIQRLIAEQSDEHDRAAECVDHDEEDAASYVITVSEPVVTMTPGRGNERRPEHAGPVQVADRPQDVPRARMMVVGGTTVSARELGAYLQQLREEGLSPAEVTIRPASEKFAEAEQMVQPEQSSNTVVTENPELDDNLGLVVPAEQIQPEALGMEAVPETVDPQDAPEAVVTVSGNGTVPQAVVGDVVHDQEVEHRSITAAPEYVLHTPDGGASVNTPEVMADAAVTVGASEVSSATVEASTDAPVQAAVTDPVVPGDSRESGESKEEMKSHLHIHPTSAESEPTGAAQQGAQAVVTEPIAVTSEQEPVVSEAVPVRTVTPTNMPGELVRMATMARSDGKAEVRMQLDPPELGSVLVKISSDKGRLNAELTVTTAEALSALRDGLARLRADLIAAGYEVENLDVSLADRGSSERGQEMARGQDQREHDPVVPRQPRQDVYQRLRVLQPESSFEYVA